MFSTSPFIQTSDYEAAADLTFANTYLINSAFLQVPLLPAAIQFLSTTQSNQFRITMTANSFSNYNGQQRHQHSTHGLPG